MLVETFARGWENLVRPLGRADEFSFFDSTGGGDFLRHSRWRQGRSRKQADVSGVCTLESAFVVGRGCDSPGRTWGQSLSSRSFWTRFTRSSCILESSRWNC